MVTKVYDGNLEVSEGKREVLAVISSDAVDRDREVVRPGGMKKKNYAGNPVVMVNHDYRSLPIGAARWIKADGNRVLAKYYVSDKTQLARDVFGLIQDKVLNAHSIGFTSLYASAPTTAEINQRADLKSAKLIHRDWELNEFSVVGIPANPEALTLAVSKGYSESTIALLSGKTKAEQEKTEEIVEAVKDQFEQKPMTRKELIAALENRVNEISIALDANRVIEKAFDVLKRRTR